LANPVVIARANCENCLVRSAIESTRVEGGGFDVEAGGGAGGGVVETVMGTVTEDIGVDVDEG
jgi:hypothetical protein